MWNVPMRFAIKFGVSFARTTALPSRLSQNAAIAAKSAASVSGVAITSTSRMYRGGLKKCVPNQCRRSSSDIPSTMLATGSPEVLVVTIVPALRCCSTFASSARFISRFSATASTIQSHSAIRAMSSPKFPRVISRAASGVKNAAGFDFFNPSSAASDSLFRAATPASAPSSGGTISSSTTGTPALAICAAIREPIVPAPSTATLRICFIGIAPQRALARLFSRVALSSRWSAPIPSATIGSTMRSPIRATK